MQLDRHTVLLRRFAIRTVVDGLEVELDVETREDGSARCHSVAVKSPDDGPELGSLDDPVDVGVTNAVLRKVKVAEFIARARRTPFVLMDAKLTATGFRGEALSAESAAELPDRYGIGKHRPTRGKPLTDKLLKGVASEYRDAVKRGENPTQRICEVARITRPTASRWIRAARDREFLGKATPGKAGEIA